MKTSSSEASLSVKEGALHTAAAFVFNNRIHIFPMAIGATLFWDVTLRFGLPLVYYVIITLATTAAYMSNMLTDKEEDEINYPDEARYLGARGALTKGLIAACCLGALALSLAAGWAFVLLIGLVIFLGFFYGFKVQLPGASGGKSFRLKSIPILKNAYVATLWSVILIITPYVYLGRSLELLVIFAMAANFMVSFIIELLWDVRDIEGDTEAHVLTIPIWLGKQRSRLILHGVNAVLGLLMLAGYLAGGISLVYLIVLLQVALTAWFIEWYFRLDDKQLASHLYLLGIGGIMLAIIIVGNLT